MTALSTIMASCLAATAIASAQVVPAAPPPTPAATAPAPAAGKPVDLQVAGGKVVNAPDTLRVKQGEAVQLCWTTDKPMDLHLHGYDIEIRTQANTPAPMSFVAKLPGRFPVSEHGQASGHSHHALMYLEVLP